MITPWTVEQLADIREALPACKGEIVAILSIDKSWHCQGYFPRQNMHYLLALDCAASKSIPRIEAKPT